MREGIGGENWTVVGQTNAREGGREKLDSSRTDDCTGGGGKNWTVRYVNLIIQ